MSLLLAGYFENGVSHRVRVQWTYDRLSHCHSNVFEQVMSFVRLWYFCEKFLKDIVRKTVFEGGLFQSNYFHNRSFSRRRL